jgi:hypothetical protein
MLRRLRFAAVKHAAGRIVWVAMIIKTFGLF